MSLHVLILRYACFAVISTVANLATQRLVLTQGDAPLFFGAAVLAGTAVGLAVKYVLDKRWIFYDASTGLKSHSRKFTLYTGMGIITTLIFWGAETLFWVIWGTPMMREVGACLGLAVGYVVKYQLDRRFVFSDAAFPLKRTA